MARNQVKPQPDPLQPASLISAIDNMNQICLELVTEFGGNVDLQIAADIMLNAACELQTLVVKGNRK